MGVLNLHGAPIIIDKLYIVCGYGLVTLVVKVLACGVVDFSTTT